MLKFHPIGSFTFHDKVILAGAVSMAAGTLLPIVKLPVVGSINYVAGGRGDGITILALACAVIAAVFYQYRRTAAGVGFAALIMMMHTLSELLNTLSKMWDTAKIVEDTPFGVLATTVLSNTVGFGWGWVPLIGGALAVVAAGLTSGKAPAAIEGYANEHNRANGSPLKLDPKQLAVWARSVASKVASYTQKKLIARSVPNAPQVPTAPGERRGSISAYEPVIRWTACGIAAVGAVLSIAFLLFASN